MLLVMVEMLSATVYGPSGPQNSFKSKKGTPPKKKGTFQGSPRYAAHTKTRKTAFLQSTKGDDKVLKKLR